MTTMRERFDEQFPHGNRIGSSVRANEVLDFIEQELKKEREEIVDWIEKEDWECFEQTFIKEDIINTIKDRV